MSAENEIDPGELPARLYRPVACADDGLSICTVYVRYTITQDTVNFLQNNAKTVDPLPTLPSELHKMLWSCNPQIK